jgi:2-aminobenzoate-CoA ligase
MTAYTAHQDTFVLDNLPHADDQAEYLFDLPELKYPARVNAGRILDEAAIEHRNRPALMMGDLTWTYAELHDRANRIARLLTEDLGVVPGNRVMLHAANRPWTVAAWFAIVKVGAVAVTTMPMLRAAELAKVVGKAQIRHALVQPDLYDAVAGAGPLDAIVRLGDEAFEMALAAKSPGFVNADTSRDDPVLIAFTSGTTGEPKGCIHFHRDVLSMADTFARHILKPKSTDVFCGTPPYAFTFGLASLIGYPFSVGAAVALSEKAGFEGLCEVIQRHRATVLFTAPTGYRALLKLIDQYDLSSLRLCVSAGETLPQATSDAWFKATRLRIIDGIGSTEMIHIFLSASGDDIRPGSTGKPIPGYLAEIHDEAGNALPLGETGRLAVRGPNGCRYLADPRQKAYVQNGWNMTGDFYRQDQDGYFWFVSRSDDIIVSSGYNIAAAEVEAALLAHPAVAETGVVSAPDEERGRIVKAFVVLKEGFEPSAQTVKALQDFVKQTIAPFKYPRAVEFVTELPKTHTGKVQRFKLREGDGG